MSLLPSAHLVYECLVDLEGGQHKRVYCKEHVVQHDGDFRARVNAGVFGLDCVHVVEAHIVRRIARPARNVEEQKIKVQADNAFPEVVFNRLRGGWYNGIENWSGRQGSLKAGTDDI